MAEYYNSQLGKRSRRDSRQQHTSIWVAILDIVMLCVSIVAIVTLFTIFIGRFFEPEKLWYFSLAGLVAPIIYVISIATTLYWIIRWRWKMFILMAAFIALGWPYVSLYYKVNIGKEYGTPKYERGNIKILSYNIRYFHDEKWLKTTTDSIISIIRKENPDIICFQEYPIKGEEQDKAFRELSKYHHTEIHSLYDDGVICFSKHRIIRSDSIKDLCGTAKGLWADLKINNDTVRLYNVHLQSTFINPEEREYLNNKRFLESADSGRITKFSGMAQRLYENSCMRAHQVDALRHDMDHCPYPIIVCGDFNDVPMSYTYRTVASRLNDTFSEQGNGYAHTYDGLFNLLRIDYILVSKQFKTLSYEVLPTNLSDHYPVISRVILKKE